MGTVKSDIYIDAPVDEVHNFGHDPNKWSQWYVNFRGPEKMTGNGAAGTIVEGEYTLMGVHIPVRIEVIEDTRNHWESRITGAMEGEMNVTMVPDGSGSHVEFRWTYALPSELLSKLVDSRFAEKMMERALVHTMENWKMMCEMKH